MREFCFSCSAAADIVSLPSALICGKTPYILVFRIGGTSWVRDGGTLWVGGGGYIGAGRGRGVEARSWSKKLFLGTFQKITTYWPPLDERVRSGFAESCKIRVIIYKTLSIFMDFM